MPDLFCDRDPFDDTPDAKRSGVSALPEPEDDNAILRNFGERNRPKQAPAGKRKHQVDHHDRTRKLLDSMGIFNTRCEWQVTFGYGDSTVVKSRDLWGLFDRCGVEKGRFVGIQISAYDSVTAHIRKMCSDEPTKSDQKRTYRENLRDFLGAGGRAIVVGWKQEGDIGSKWEPFVREVTKEDLEIVVAGGRLKLESG